MPEGGNIPPDNHAPAQAIAPHVTRMIDEAEALAEKLSKLEKFFTGVVFADLSPEDQNLMRAQAGAMSAYLHILRVRIDKAK